MPFLFPNARLRVATLDGWSDFIVAEQEGAAPGSGLPFRTRAGRLLRSRSGASSDGLSGPKFAKCRLQSSASFFPAVAHDAAYRGDLEESRDGGATWQRVALTKAEADDLLAELCADNQVPLDEAQAIYLAIHLFGQAAWDADAKFRGV